MPSLAEVESCSPTTANATAAPDKYPGMMRDSIAIAQEIGREMKLEAADALLSVSSAPRERNKIVEREVEDPVDEPNCAVRREGDSVKVELVDETIKQTVTKEGTIRAALTEKDATASPNHHPQQSKLPVNYMERKPHTNTAGFFPPYPDHMHSFMTMNHRSLSHPMTGINHQFANNYPYAMPYPPPYMNHPWHAGVGRSSFDQSRSRNRCTAKMPSITPRVWSREEISNAPQLPDHSELINFPLPSRGVPFHQRQCTMCGKKPGFNSNILHQNRQICTSCDVAIFSINDGSGLEIKYCKGCKRFKAWVEFHDKPMATKCACCRQRERQYFAKKAGDKEGPSINIYEDEKMSPIPRSQPSWIQHRDRPLIPMPPALSYPMYTGRNRCVRLKEPITSMHKKWSEKEKNDNSIPDFNSIVNFNPSLEIRNRCFDDGLRKCVMCGLMRIAAAALKTSSAKLRQGQPQPIIPKQNKGICTECDVAIWVIVAERKEIKFCKGCKNFRTWASFGERRRATKCERCRSRQRSKYYQKKESSIDKNSCEELKNKETTSDTSKKKDEVVVLADSDNCQSGKENQTIR